MTVKQQLQQALANLPLFSAGEQVVEVHDSGQALRCQLVALDTLACAFARLSLQADALSVMSIEQLKTTAEKLAGRLTYLLEPISPIEIDSQGCVVQLRSNPPHKETDRTSYYELLVSRLGEISLGRYTRTAAQERQSIPAEVTREVLSRLAADFSAVAG